MTRRVDRGSSSNRRCKTLVGVDERTKGDEVERQAPGRTKELG